MKLCLFDQKGREGKGKLGFTMVLTLHGNPEIDPHVRSNPSYLICVRHLLISRIVTNRIYFFLHKDILSYMRTKHVLSNTI